MKKKKLYIMILFLVIIILMVFGLYKLFKKPSAVDKAVDKTIASKSNGYKLDLRISGRYNLSSVYNIVMVQNYKNKDLDIKITDVLMSSQKITNKLVKDNGITYYVLKDGKKYVYKNKKLQDTKSILYSNTDIYLTKIKKVKKLKKLKEENSYIIYTGILKSKEMNELFKASNINYKTKENANVEVWLSADNYIYRVIYKVEKMNINGLYSSYGMIREINLDSYKDNNKA